RLGNGKAKLEDDGDQKAEALPVATSPKHAALSEDGGPGTDDGTSASMSSVDPALLDEEEIPFSPLSSPPRPQTFGGGEGGYNSLKLFKGQYYSGMAIGGSHTWTYDSGVWKETKIEPDLWRIDYETHKRRARNAPKGSGAPVGTEYHWYIVA